MKRLNRRLLPVCMMLAVVVAAGFALACSTQNPVLPEENGQQTNGGAVTTDDPTDTVVQDSQPWDGAESSDSSPTVSCTNVIIPGGSTSCPTTWPVLGLKTCHRACPPECCSQPTQPPFVFEFKGVVAKTATAVPDPATGAQMIQPSLTPLPGVWEAAAAQGVTLDPTIMMVVYYPNEDVEQTAWKHPSTCPDGSTPSPPPISLHFGRSAWSDSPSAGITYQQVAVCDKPAGWYVKNWLLVDVILNGFVVQEGVVEFVVQTPEGPKLKSILKPFRFTFNKLLPEPKCFPDGTISPGGVGVTDEFNQETQMAKVQFNPHATYGYYGNHEVHAPPGAMCEEGMTPVPSGLLGWDYNFSSPPPDRVFASYASAWCNDAELKGLCHTMCYKQVQATGEFIGFYNPL